MNLITGRAGAAHITPRQDAMWHQGLIEMESCIFDAYENFAAEIITNNEVRIRSGVGMLQGRFFCIEPNTYDSAEIANGNQGEERIDLIVARIAVDASANTQSASIEVIQGTPAAENPTTPKAVTGDLDAGDLIADYPLVEVHISGINITSIENTFNAGWLSLPQTRQNINVIGLNPITSPANDTPANWVALGTGIAYFNKASCLNNQPATNGFIANKVYGSTVHQTFYLRGTAGTLWVRAGNASGWGSSWVKILNESSGTQAVKVWTNASPTSAFAAQTVSVDLSDGDFIDIEFASGSEKFIQRYSIGTTGIAQTSVIYDGTNDYVGFAERKFTVNTNNIVFQGAYYKFAGGSGSASNTLSNTWMIPQAIYLVKGVQ